MKKVWGKIILGTICILGCSLFAPSIGAKAASLHGSSNEEKIFFFLREEMNFNNAAGAGVLANIEKESSFRTNALSDGGTSYGICQWHAERMSRLRAWCDDHGYDWEDLEGQLYYLEYELDTYYPYTCSVLRGVKNSKSGAYRAGHDWCYYFEVPADKEERARERGELARDYYWPKYKNVKTKLQKGKTYETDIGIFKATGDFEVTFLEMTDEEVTSLEIPGKVKIGNITAKITAISPRAFEDNENLESVTIGGNVTKIGKCAFAGCSHLNEITIKSKKIKTFGKACFRDISETAVFYVKKAVKKKYAKKLKKVSPEGIEIQKY
ncbi:Leucine rich repeat-containing protein [Butyrivibrio sp. ob235]|uniref:phage tail tip lysozyme n=1 Tax=Butyrivibrio sp. ob235 TaxID=1761780 RepID=UPI0008D1B5E0|nr:phage tail tip lysozyme [Butyrivibrio sp. ob235]SEL06966.1 Leucine rich repeat-containing protein [Butyrivibrio sp. ob235]